MQLNRENFDAINAEILKRNDISLWVNTQNVTGFKNLQDKWEQLPHPMIYDIKHLVEAVHYGSTSIDSMLTIIAYQVEQVEPIGVIEYKADSEANRIDIRIRWPKINSIN